MITIRRIKNLFINIFYYKAKRLVFKIIKNKKVSLHSLLKLNILISSKLLKQSYKLRDNFKNYIFEFSKTIRFAYLTTIKIILCLLKTLNIINALNILIFNIIIYEKF